MQLNIAQKLLANGRAHAVGEYRGDAPSILLDPRKRHAEAIASGRERRAQRAIEPAPGGHEPRRLFLTVDAAACVETDEAVELDPHGLVEIDADAPENIEELRMRAQPRAAPGQVLRIALEESDVPTFAAQEIGGEQSAERPPDHQCAPCRH